MPVLDAQERQARRDALAAAGRSCEIEGLPPPSEMALALYERWIDGELTGDQVAAQLVAYHRGLAQAAETADSGATG
jgi:hypothetical protein